MIKRLLAWGVDDRLSPFDKNQYKLINGMIWFSVMAKLLGVVYVGVFESLSTEQLLQTIVTLGMNALMLYFNAKGRFHITRQLFIALVFIGLIAMVFIFRVDFYSHVLFLLSLFCFLTIIIESPRRVFYLTLIAVSITVLGLINTRYELFAPRVVFPLDQIATVRFASILVIAFTLFYTVYLKSYAVNYKNELEAALTTISNQNRQLDRNVREKEVLLAETHHRVKNNLQLIISLLELQIDAMRQDAQTEALKVSVARIRSMSTIHKKLYNDDDHIDHIELSGYLRELATNVIELYPELSNRIVIDYDVCTYLLDIERAIPLGLIINEVITNSVKYGVIEGQTNHFSLRMSIHDGILTIVFKDSGKGLSENSASGLGSDLIAMLTHQIKGSISHLNDNGLQTTLTIALDGTP